MQNGDRLFDSLANLVGDVVTDIRQRVVEEGWFGQITGAPNFYEASWESYGHPKDNPISQTDQGIDL